MALSETFGRSDQPWTLPAIPGYGSWRTERSGGDKGGGGLCILYRETLTPHHWTPQVPSNLKYVENERQWLLIDNGTEKIALLHCYIACQNNKNEDYLQWNESLFHLLSLELAKLREHGFMTLCMGDFNSRVGQIPGLEKNTPHINKNGPMFLNFCLQANLVIINTLPITKGLFTRFMNHTSQPGTQSLLDYGLVDADHVNTVTSFVIDAEARYSCGSDHALLIAKIIFGLKPSVNWSFHEVLHFNINPKTNYTKYQDVLDQQSSTLPLHKYEELSAEEKLQHLTTSIIESGKKAIGLKTKKKKQPQKLPKTLLTKIKAKNMLSEQVYQASKESLPNINTLQAKLTIMKLEIKDILISMKLTKRFKLRSKLLLADPSRRLFWRFLKNQMKSAGSITGAYTKSGNMVFQQDEIEDAILDHFTEIFIGQRIPVFPTADHPDQTTLTLQDIGNILANYSPNCPVDKFDKEVCTPYTLTELTQILGSLSTGKAAGFDQLPNELLKHCSQKFKQYLLLFLNQIIEEGRVPESLNLGKCMLIHKVRIPPPTLSMTKIFVFLYTILKL